MNREIKFRGQSISGFWHYGLLAIIKLKQGLVSEGSYISNSAGMPLAYHVRPETVGQYTGRKDKNGKEIYEGDVIETNYGKVGSVVYYERSASFIIHDPSHFNEQLWHDAPYCEVIGNIYETPQLLSSGQDDERSVATGMLNEQNDE